MTPLILTRADTERLIADIEARRAANESPAPQPLDITITHEDGAALVARIRGNLERTEEYIPEPRPAYLWSETLAETESDNDEPCSLNADRYRGLDGGEYNQFQFVYVGNWDCFGDMWWENYPSIAAIPEPWRSVAAQFEADYPQTKGESK